jgi:hypothetical protein
MMETFKRSVQGKSMDKPKKELNQIHHNNGTTSCLSLDREWWWVAANILRRRVQGQGVRA